MADKDIDKKGRGWLGKKMASKSGKIDNLGLLKEAVVKDGLGGQPVALALMASVTAAMLGSIGGMINEGMTSDYIQPADPTLAYSDTGTGYEAIKYARNEPAIALVRHEGGAISLYNVANNGEMRLLTEPEAWSVAARITTVLNERIEQLNNPAVAVGDDSFLPVFPSYENITLAWRATGSGGQDVFFRHAQGTAGSQIDVPFQDLDEKYAREVEQWQAVRTHITSGAPYAIPDEQNLTQVSNDDAAKDQFITGQIAVSSAILGLFGLLVGHSATQGFRRRKERAEESLRHNLR